MKTIYAFPLLITLISLFAVHGTLAQDKATFSKKVVVHPVIWERNGSSTVPDGLMGVHATPLSEQRVNDWGITNLRKIHHQHILPTRVEGVKTIIKKGKRGKKDKIISKGYPKGIRYIVDCLYDRYQAALQIREPKTWKQSLMKTATRYAAAAKKSDQQHFLEFWNEPYLNW